MSINKYEKHLVIFLEDEPYRSILNGVKKSTNTNAHVIDIKEPCGGWKKVFDNLEENLNLVKNNKQCHILLLMDFDDKSTNQLGSFQARRDKLNEIVPEQYRNRVFILGVNHKEVENLKRFLKKSNLEEIGKLLIKDCPDSNLSSWGNTHLECNLPEIERMRGLGVFGWLFS